MFRIIKMPLTWVVVLVLGFVAIQANAEEAQVLKTKTDKENYSIGVNLVKSFKQQGIEVDLDVVIRGMKDALAGGKLLMTDDELRKTFSAFQNELRLKQRQTRSMSAVDGRREGEVFLAENKKKEGVITLPSGLQYKILKAGDGIKPMETDTVEVNYRGTLINGTEIDNSYRSGRPANLKVSTVILGWKEALKLMPVGSKWQLFIPPQLAYGERAAGRGIGPNTTLIFELELIAIE
jgi:FKBP-type peptidyl-prolyl cis-trans isomerase